MQHRRADRDDLIQPKLCKRHREVVCRVLISVCFVFFLPQTTSCFQVMAMCDFPAIQDDELGFNAGDVIEVLDMSDPFWWKGKLKGIIGLFPVNATRPL